MSGEQQKLLTAGDMELWDGDTLVARVKEWDVTHKGNDTRTPVMGVIIFREIIGEPSLINTFTMKAGNRQWRFNFVGEKPTETFEVKGNDEAEKYNYPIEADREYQFFARKIIPMSDNARKWLDKMGQIQC